MKTWLVILCTAILLSGCGNPTNNEASPPPNQDNRNVRVKQSVPPKKDIKNPQEVAERLSNLAASIPQVESATCVVFGDTAIIGINVSGEMESSKVGTIKYSVAEALRNDPYGVHALVTADMDLYNRLDELAAQVRQGNPISGFANEIADIIGRVIPQIPSDIITPDESEQADMSRR